MAVFNTWSNQHLDLYHGTTLKNAMSIQQKIDTSVGRAQTDFGTGFYTTTWYEQAESWSLSRIASQRDEQAVVIKFEVCRIELSKLDSIHFVRGHKNAHDFWSFVNHCRSGGNCHIPQSDWYDLVIGPVAILPCFKRKILPGFDQISFHSEKSAAVLDRSVKSIIHVN